MTIDNCENWDAKYKSCLWLAHRLIIGQPQWRQNTLELRDLRTLIGISETGSLSAAARKLHLTQPALSASLRRLEEELGVQLVRRHSRGAVLTEEGRYVLQKAYGIVQDVAEVVSVVHSLAEEPVGTVNLGLPTTVAGGLIPELLPLLRQRFPRIKLHIIEAMSGVLVELLQLGRLDMAVMFDIQPMAGLRSEPILKERLYFLVPSDHHLAQRESVRFEEVARVGLVLPSVENSIRKLIETTCQAEGLSLNVLADVDSLPGLINLVKGGYCTILPIYLVTDHIKSGVISAIEITRPELAWTIHLATRNDAIRPRASLTTGRILVEACKKLVESGDWPGYIENRG
ncbi:LysR family transcriptional regulator [Tepidamorphus sp. 3E244]|uniref:LysR family transcriptional regulator n=1 Tax=Tepidamorphus sp. 3E244 TaxID=3385498 RepID=UPI0038FBF7FB